MRTLPIAVSVLALMTASAFAQAPASPSRPAAPGTAATAPAPSAPKVNPLAQDDVSQIIGTAVIGNDGNKIGSVSTVLMQPDDKKIDKLVVRAGGVLGVGGHLVALPLEAFSWNANDGEFKIAKTADDVKSMAAWNETGSTNSMSGSSAPLPSTRPAPADGSGSNR